MDDPNTINFYLLPKKRGSIFASGNVRDRINQILSESIPHRCLITIHNTVRPITKAPPPALVQPLEDGATHPHTNPPITAPNAPHEWILGGEAVGSNGVQEGTVGKATSRFCPARKIPFSTIGWTRPSPASPEAFGHLVAVDQRGDIWSLDWDQNRYKQIVRTGISATAFGYGLGRTPWYVFGLSNRSIVVYRYDTCGMVCTRPRAHLSPPRGISVHPTQSFCLTTSWEDLVVWDTTTWTQLHVLPASPAKIFQAQYSNCGQYIIASFDTDTLVIWDSQTFAKVWKVKPPPLPSPEDPDHPRYGRMYNSKISRVSPRLTTYAVDQRSRYLVAGGCTMSLWVWSLPQQTLLQEFTTPVLGDGVSQLEFVGKDDILAILTLAGRVYLLNIRDCRFIHVAFSFSVSQLTLSRCGRLLAVMPVFAPYNIKIYPLEALLSSLRDPAKPILNTPTKRSYLMSFPNGSPAVSSRHQSVPRTTNHISDAPSVRRNHSKGKQPETPDSPNLYHGGSSSAAPFQPHATKAVNLAPSQSLAENETLYPSGRDMHTSRTLVNPPGELTPISSPHLPDSRLARTDEEYIAILDRLEQQRVRSQLEDLRGRISNLQNHFH
ncbi:hypothetical protein IWQ61_002067 [Dispira simplex]|nr:hypothetical protein IWQ61_002067 [Dispira simplex]